MSDPTSAKVFGDAELDLLAWLLEACPSLLISISSAKRCKQDRRSPVSKMITFPNFMEIRLTFGFRSRGCVASLLLLVVFLVVFGAGVGASTANLTQKSVGIKKLFHFNVNFRQTVPAGVVTAVAI